jgi:hypothetical protein
MYEKQIKMCGYAKYRSRCNFSLTVKMLPAIAFCPVADVVDAFETCLDGRNQ